jgi:hypothetical protein
LREKCLQLPGLIPMIETFQQSKVFSRYSLELIADEISWRPAFSGLHFGQYKSGSRTTHPKVLLNVLSSNKMVSIE